ncbi:MAG: hypothetical protein IT265_04070 [Saprospiraceae bacterium]|nr:hypothetical protein [Saprospiraceae bacterium]
MESIFNRNGVKYNLGCTVKEIISNHTVLVTSIVNANIEFHDKSIKEIKGDYFILVVHVEQAANLICDEMIKANHTLAYIKTLAPRIGWMNVIPSYLNENAFIPESCIRFRSENKKINLPACAAGRKRRVLT